MALGTESDHGAQAASYAKDVYSACVVFSLCPVLRAALLETFIGGYRVLVRSRTNVMPCTIFARVYETPRLDAFSYVRHGTAVGVTKLGRTEISSSHSLLRLSFKGAESKEERKKTSRTTIPTDAEETGLPCDLSCVTDLCSQVPRAGGRRAVEFVEFAERGHFGSTLPRSPKK